MRKLFSFQCLIDILGKQHLWRRQHILPRRRLCVPRRGAPRRRSDLLPPKLRCCPGPLTPYPHPVGWESPRSVRALGQLEGQMLSSAASQTFGREETLESFALRDARSSARRAASATGLYSGVGTAASLWELPAASLLLPEGASSP